MEMLVGAALAAAFSLLVAALALARAGQRRAQHRGWPLWLAAAVGGSVAALAWPWAASLPLGRPAVAALLLSWPVALLIGLRRFHGRLGLAGNERLDIAVYLIGVLLTAIGMVAAAPDAWGAAGALAVHGYTAAVIGSSRSLEDAALVRLQAVAVAIAGACAVSPSLGGLTGPGGAPGPLWALGSALALLVSTVVALTLMNERTERELLESRRRMRELADTDGLTGVPNLRHFHDHGQRLLQVPGGPRPVLLLLDIDHFKQINDRLGHAAGNRALQLMGRCLMQVLRAHDLAARLGGDEFALLLDGVTVEQAMGVAQRIVQTLQDQSASQRLPRLGTSIGIVQTRAGEDLDAALRRADQALYEAKRQGRSCAVSASGDEDSPVFAESQRLGLTPM